VRGNHLERTILTVELVETLQTMAMKGKPITDVIEGLRYASLPGLVEYGCLRFAMREVFPPLPDQNVDSPLGRSLCSIQSELGLSVAGPRKTTVKDVSPREFEFTTISDESDTLGSDWENFLQRFERSAKEVGFSGESALNLQSALDEMATNAVIHSRARLPALVGYTVANNLAVFSVADVGRGIVASLTSNPKYAHLVEPVDAIGKALQTGVTCRIDDDGGFGFSTIFKALAESWGQLRFRSGNGCITMDGTDLAVDKSIRRFPPALPGFQVSVCCQSQDSLIASF
jgi:hypothetical protein